jgi:hypothetical protein
MWRVDENPERVGDDHTTIDSFAGAIAELACVREDLFLTLDRDAANPAHEVAEREVADHDRAGDAAAAGRSADW